MKGNKYILKENYVELIINSKKYGVIRAKIDIEDIEKCKQITWHYSNSRDIPYICGKVKNKNIKLHRYLLNLNNSNYVVDHINRNTLDNRRINLRVADYQENSFNRGIRSDNTSGVIGVDFNKRAKKWRAKIKYNSEDIHLGYFKDIKEALINRRIAEEILFGEYRPNSKLNNVDEELLCNARENIMRRIENKVA